MQAQRIVTLFRNGRNQALRIPRDLELQGKSAILTKEGDALVIRPMPKKPLLELLASWEPLDEDFPEIDNLPPLDEVEL